MAYFPEPQSQAATRGVEIDAGLRAYMLQIYNYMASALVLTGLVAWFAAQAAVVPGPEGSLVLSKFGEMTLTSPGMWILVFAPLGVVWYLSARIHALSVNAAKGWFWAYSVLLGLMLSSIFLAYTGESIARTFFITAGTFGAMSLYGYSTKKDLSGWGSFLFMGLIGLIIASVVNLFLNSGPLGFAISAAGVLVFTGLTAYDTQKLKTTYYALAGHGEAMQKASIMGALNLYMDFINLFLMLLRFVGDRR